jgi:hypothetical protein
MERLEPRPLLSELTPVRSRPPFLFFLFLFLIHLLTLANGPEQTRLRPTLAGCQAAPCSRPTGSVPLTTSTSARFLPLLPPRLPLLPLQSHPPRGHAQSRFIARLHQLRGVCAHHHHHHKFSLPWRVLIAELHLLFVCPQAICPRPSLSRLATCPRV